MAQLVSYEFEATAVATSGEVYLGTITPGSTDDLMVESVQITPIDPATANPPVTYRMRALTDDGVGTAVVGQKMNRTKSAAITSTGQKPTFSTAPTAATGSPQDGATLAYTQPFFKTYGGKLIVKYGEALGITIERNSATGTITVRVYVTVWE